MLSKIAGNGSENAVVKAIPKANTEVMVKEKMVVSTALRRAMRRASRKGMERARWKRKEKEVQERQAPLEPIGK